MELYSICLHCFPVAAGTNGHKPGGLKQQTSISSQFGGQKPQITTPGLESAHSDSAVSASVATWIPPLLCPTTLLHMPLPQSPSE